MVESAGRLTCACMSQTEKGPSDDVACYACDCGTLRKPRL